MSFGCAILVHIKHGSFVRSEFKVSTSRLRFKRMCSCFHFMLYSIVRYYFWVNGDLCNLQGIVFGVYVAFWTGLRLKSAISLKGI